jgi:hypothetical protein
VLKGEKMHSGRKIKIEAPLAISGVSIFVLALLALVLPALAAPVAEVVISDASAYPMETTSLSIITINNAENVGVVDLNLRYDPSVVMVINVTGVDFDVTIPNLEHKSNGSVRMGAYQTNNSGLNDTITIANVTLKAMGNPGGISPLNIIVNEFKYATPQGTTINYTITNGTFTIISPGVTPTPTPTPSNGGGDGGGGDGAFIPTPSPIPTSASTATPTPTETSTPAPSITPSSTTQTPTPTPVPVPRTPPLFLILIVIAVIVIAGIIIIIVLSR